MSRDPQTLSPETPVNEAADMILKFGYEGYPVVGDGEIVGLLTRRAVDRALAHELNLTAASLMDAGSIRVFPSDSIEHIQDVMTESGWGQIPVVSSRSKKIVGIVTRTDLIKILAPSHLTPGHQNLSPRLEATLPEVRVELLNRIAEIAAEQKSALYIVGGFVRDLLLDHPSLDFDLVVEGDAIVLAETIKERYGGRVTSHSRFGTAKWFIDKHQLTILGSTKKLRESLPDTLDFISARTEFYTHPTALPTVERGSIKLDLHRRDFTINTLALRLDGHHYGELYDYWGGLADLKGKLVKVLHSLSFVDDPTRILRAVRYEKRYDLQLDLRTEELLLEAKELLKRVSGDRIRHELDRIFDEENAAQMMDRLHQLTILKAIHTDLEWDKKLHSLVKSLPGKEHPPEWKIDQEDSGLPIHRDLIYTVWLMRSHQSGEVCKRLKLISTLTDVIQEASSLLRRIKNLYKQPPSQITADLDRVSNLAIYAVYLVVEEPKYKGILSHYLSSWQHIESNITGQDLKKAGLEPGPRYAEILTQIRNAWLDEEISNKKAEKALLKSLLTEEDKE